MYMIEPKKYLCIASYKKLLYEYTQVYEPKYKHSDSGYLKVYKRVHVKILKNVQCIKALAFSLHRNIL